jgi:hypothetical protein
MYPDEWQAKIAKNIKSIIEGHQRKTVRPVPEDIPDVHSGVSWRVLAEIAARGDFKGRRKGKLVQYGMNVANKLGLTLEEIKASEIDLETRY